MDQPRATWSHCLEHAALSDVGRQRVNNQDSFVVTLADNQSDFEKRGHLFLVADGMGAHAAGELASKMAADTISLVYRKRPSRLPSEAILAAMINANHQIHGRGQASPDFHGMGTTTTTLLILPAGAMLAHVGDSRAYRWRNHRIEQLTFDHSLVWEMRAAGQFPNNEVPGYISRNIITRSLGPHPAVKVDLEGPHPIENGDTFLLCTDGLSNQIQDDEIGLVLGCLPPAEAVRALVDLANLRGGPDNITIVVAKALGPQIAEASRDSDAAPGAAFDVRPIHPAIWTLIGVAFFLAVGLLAFGYPPLYALLSLLAAGVGGVTALVQRYIGINRRTSWRNRRFGRGPYVTGECQPSPQLLGRLNDILQHLKKAVAKENSTVDRDAFGAFLARVSAATQAGNLGEAARESLRAIMFVMEQLRQDQDTSSDDSGVIGLEMAD
jgi:protein phosphatase